MGSNPTSDSKIFIFNNLGQHLTCVPANVVVASALQCRDSRNILTELLSDSHVKGSVAERSKALV